jgi:RNA 3'-terminal phosphate cyclase (ATP)
VLHTLYLPLALRGATASEVTITGGTHVKTSPCYHFLAVTWRPWLERLGLRVRLDLKHPGFYPRGGGVLHAHIEPTPKLQGLLLDRVAAPTRITGVSAVAGLPEDIAERQARQAVKRLRETRLDVDIRQENWKGGPGTMLALVAEAAPVPALFFSLGERGKRAEAVADEAVAQVKAFLGAAPPGVDPHSADQLVLPLALAEGPSRFPVAEVTQHLHTNVAVIRQFLDRDIVCAGNEGEPGRVQIV